MKHLFDENKTSEVSGLFGQKMFCGIAIPLILSLCNLSAEISVLGFTFYAPRLNDLVSLLCQAPSDVIIGHLDPLSPDDLGRGRVFPQTYLVFICRG